MRMLMRWFAALLLGAALVAPAAQAAESTDPQAAQQMIQQTANQVLARLKQDRDQLKAHPERLYAMVQKLVLPHFDFVLMSRWVLGRYWRQASPEQQKAFVEQFRNLLVRTYATALLNYTDQKLLYLPLRAASDADDITVRTEVQQAGGNIAINYSLTYRNSVWKVYDISVDGVSLVTNYRSSFSSQIRDSGVGALIDHLKALNEKKDRSNG